MTTTGFDAVFSDVRVTFGRTDALDGASFTLPSGTITGMLGRNGAGKSTALALLAAFRRPDAGTVLVQGHDPFENAAVTAGVQLVRESGDVLGDSPVKETLGYYSDARPDWDGETARRLLDLFEVPLDRSPDSLSRGKRSALGCVLGIAARAPLTIFDESYLGMDAPSRYAFYDALLDDYTAHPRTIVVSSHLIDEVERLFENVVVLHRGAVLTQTDADDLRARAVSLTGPASAVRPLTDGHAVLAQRSLGTTTQVTLNGPFDPDLPRKAAQAGVEVGRVSLQDIFVHLTQEAR
ncbi:ABC-2 type transport system ATP-binding protein [Mumia flava]|uniref:ABC-2 type transport system ATP-binding protein n=1 Tax=Mumia flava TaxID=1348852 RepID=A0A0B2B4Q1_9ACTN|nr:ABC transporter ATP-binding protein [Mumia flava]PJJ53596.1 ABC-2 type transport system ATP-binding protein [Mumia flava]